MLNKGFIYVMPCAVWHHLYNLKNVKNTHRRVLLLVKLQALAYNFIKSNTHPWMFLMFFELYKWYHIAQSISCHTFLVSFTSCIKVQDVLTDLLVFL